MGIKRLRTGIRGFDRVLGGGMPFKTNIVVIGKPGTGKSTFCLQITQKALDAGYSCLFITTTMKPDDVLDNMELFGFDAGGHVKSGRLAFIDCYSSRLGESEDHFRIIDISELNVLSLEIRNMLESLPKPVVIVFDCFSEILLGNEDEKTLEFLSVLDARVRSNSAIGIFTIVEDMHDDRTRTALESICDGTIRMTLEDGKRFITVCRMKSTSHPLEKFEFSIKREGIALKELEEFFEH